MATELFKKFARNLIQARKKSGGEKKPPEEAAQHFTENDPPQKVVQQSVERTALWCSNKILQISAGVMLIMSCTVWICVYYSSTKPPQQITFKGDLKEQVERFYNQGVQNGITRDDILMYCILVLTLKHGISSPATNLGQLDDPAPQQILLQGLVAPEIYHEAVNTKDRNKRVINAQGMAQYIHVESVILQQDKNTGRIGADIFGHLDINASVTKKGGPLVQKIPYASHAIIEPIPQSNLNRHGLFMLDLKEYMGAENVRKFQAELEKSRARSHQ